MKSILKTICVAVLGLVFCQDSYGQWTGPKVKPTEHTEVKYGSLTPEHRTDANMEAFRNYGLGQFIHWVLYAIPGNEWEGVSARKGAAASAWIRTWSGPPSSNKWQDTYDNLNKKLNPNDFVAQKWAKQAKDISA